MSPVVLESRETNAIPRSPGIRSRLGGLIVPSASAAAVFAVSAAIAYLATERGQVVLDLSPVDLSQAVSTLHYDVQPIIRNDSNRTVRIVGAGSRCGGQGCIDVKGLPLTLGPGESSPMKVHFQAGSPGRLDLEIPVYTDLPSQPDLPMRLTGTVQRLDPAKDDKPR